MGVLSVSTKVSSPMIYGRFAAVAICLISVSGAWAQVTDPPRVLLSELQAGQYNVGLDGVIANNMPGLREKYVTGGWLEVDNWLRAKKVPVIKGPGGILHLVDMHHRSTANYRLSIEFPGAYGVGYPNYVYYEVLADFSELSLPAFWERMKLGDPIGSVWGNRQYVWLHDRGVLQDPNTNPPPLIPGLTDDIMRNISANARFYGGYCDLEIEETDLHEGDYVFFFQEFYYADYLRSRVFIIGSEDRGGNSNAPVHFTQAEYAAGEPTSVQMSTAALCQHADAVVDPGWWGSCPGDIAGIVSSSGLNKPDRLVNGSDLAALIGDWGSTAPTLSDINTDGIVNGIDLGTLLNRWGSICGGCL
ncbi:MAG: hypothetical protein EXS12_07415 [Phycisphaerales bacterium]|nr:hypothetical protein [Phycisphaerales bacterium]